MQISQSPFGEFDGQPVELFTLENDNGMVVKITTYGGTVTSIMTPDKDGNVSDIVCGFDTLEGYFADEYKANSPYFGCIVGRYAARIKDGQFTVDGQQHQVATNDGPNHLHGGLRGFDKRVWSVAGTSEDEDSVSLSLTLKSEDGDESFPGNLNVTVHYQLTNDNELRIKYEAETDKASPVSLTNHTYFNLNGFSDKILDHVLQLGSDRYLVPDETNVPVGEEAAVEGTATDFTQPKRIGDAFTELPLGFEHFYAFDHSDGKLAKVAEVSEPTSGRKLEVMTTEPGTLFYTGRYTSDNLQRESGAKFGQFRAFCIETSKYPNGPNIEGAPRSVLRPGEKYNETTIYKISWA
ncbi:aldose epimerase family protein [Aporhodopirellula aestuarii]|uniref:Aldose 1-epimerase n=1 Tax=Aporhodopirellula aestuarii TaxID=2950107 RepID=A0ABT0UF25_9BACT|nr:aldose epimerase family protein [Aporhodopirellula aestuarii]MCM2374888.1 galactose mutarotase [Aporhodopirellula aestuarii]